MLAALQARCFDQEERAVVSAAAVHYVQGGGDTAAAKRHVRDTKFSNTQTSGSMEEANEKDSGARNWARGAAAHKAQERA